MLIPTASRLPRPVVLALLTVYLVWGSTYLAIQVALAGFPPFLLMGSRFVVAGAILFGWCRWRGAPLPDWRQWRAALLIGALLLGGGMGLTALAQQHVSSGLTAVFIACSPLIYALWAGLFGDWPTRREWLGVAVGFAGAVLLASGGPLSAQPFGVLALLGAIVCWTLGSILSLKKIRLAPGAMGFASEMLMGGVCMLLIAMLRGEAFAPVITPQAWLAWLYLVVAGSLGAFTAYMYLLPRVSPALVSSYAYVNPVIAVALGALFGGEHLGGREATAVAIILASVVLLTLGRGKIRNPLPVAETG